MFSDGDIIAVIGGVLAVIIFIVILKSLSWIVDRILRIFASNHKKKPEKLYIIKGEEKREILKASVSTIANAIDDVLKEQEYANIRLSSSLRNPCYIELTRIYEDESKSKNGQKDGFEVEYSYGHQIGKMQMGLRRYTSNDIVASNKAQEMLLCFFRGDNSYKKMVKFTYNTYSSGGDPAGDLNNWKVKHLFIALGMLGAILVLVEVLIRFQ